RMRLGGTGKELFRLGETGVADTERAAANDHLRDHRKLLPRIANPEGAEQDHERARVSDLQQRTDRGGDDVVAPIDATPRMVPAVAETNRDNRPVGAGQSHAHRRWVVDLSNDRFQPRTGYQILRQSGPVPYESLGRQPPPQHFPGHQGTNPSSRTEDGDLCGHHIPPNLMSTSARPCHTFELT